ncbi:IclR family transcriptional regulator [Celeribacter ethanolicus]|uniref:IclR family transcriptional regulator n=1 Tax=Celeribacter ethanolicus TaxID=1758178 RepID=A0A291GFU1_9RHOB|nr:IclR family transcriptional regulator [Celeribacter ethanolicus]ATG49061.1 IclR family transcriptional regulator [Celeribacter ethanolicus]TNE69472.1 MAG: IclR family transcriptional regulator [Paracoccaceae bacterium]
MRKSGPPTPASGTQALDRAIGLMRIIATSQSSGLSARELSDLTGLTQATLYRQLQALEKHGLVESEAKRYRIGRGALFLAAAAFEADPLHKVAQQPMRRVAQATGCSIALVIAQDTRAMCAARAEGTFTARTIYSNVGATAPLGLGSSSLCLLAALDDQEADHVIETNRHALIGPYFLDELALRTAIRQVQRDGYARDPGEVFQDVFGLGVPVRLPSGRTIAAIGLSAVLERVDPAREKWILSVMQEAARDIGQAANPVTGHTHCWQ